MAINQGSAGRLRAHFAPRPAPPSVGTAQRARLQSSLSGLRWWSAVAGLSGTVLFTALAVRHTDQAAAAPAASSSAAAGQLPANAPSQSLFQAQGDSGGGLLAPSSGGSFGNSPFRSSSS
jgi:hypothetical protein